LQWFGDSALVASRANFFGGEDPSGREGIYLIDEDGNLFQAGDRKMVRQISDGSRCEHSVFTGSLSVDQRDDFTYLGAS
jgi:hypothetical protein